MNGVTGDFNPRQTMLTTKFEVFRYREKYFQSLNFHNHDFFEFYLFLNGSVTYCIEEKTYELTPGDMLIIPPGKLHRPIIVNTDCTYERNVLWSTISYVDSLGDSGFSFLEGLNGFAEKGMYLINFSQDELSQVNYLFNTLCDANNAHDNSHDTVCNACITLLLTAVCKKLSNTVAKTESEGKAVPRVIAYINDNLSEDLSLDGICEEFFVSKFHLIRVFRQYTGKSVYDYIISKRIILAKRLIRQGIMPTEACYRCGFNNYSNFYKAFFKETGMKPKEFVRAVENEPGL